MKRCALSLLVILGLVGCGTTRQAAVESDVDVAKVAAIERAAATNGVQVYWVNKPRKAALAGT